MTSMMNYTTEDLIRYLYNDCSEQESIDMEKAIQQDWDLRDEYNALKESMQQLDNMIEKPRAKSVLAILNYAKSSGVVEHS